MREHRRLMAVVVCAALIASLAAVVGAATPAAATAPLVLEQIWGNGGTGPGNFNGVSGVATSATGFVYVVDSGNDRVQRFDVDGNYLSQFGGTGSGNGQFSNPTGVAVAPDGSVYVTDTGNNRIQRFDAGGAFLATWGTLGSGPSQLNGPQGVAVNASGNVFVTDTGNNRVVKFTAIGTYKTRWGVGGTANGRFDAPTGVAVSADRRVYVVDSGNHRVQQFSATGIYQLQWSLSTGVFLAPWGVAVDAAGDVFVADGSTHKIKKYSPTGTLLGTLGVAAPVGVAVGPDGVKVFVAYNSARMARFGPDPDPDVPPPVFLEVWDAGFDFPHGIAVDPSSGNVYIADTTLNQVLVFSAAGGFIDRWGSAGSGNGQLAGPTGVAADGSGNVYVADSGNHRIQKLTASGSYVTQWGGLGTANGQFNNPEGVAVDASGNVYVADTGNDRIQKFNSQGLFASKWGSAGTGTGQFNGPEGLGIDPSGNVYVADTGNWRVQRFTSSGVFTSDLRGRYGSFDNPHSVAFDPAGNVYVADTGRHRIELLTPTGGHLTEWGDAGSGDGQLLYPYGIAVNGAGLIYLTDTGNKRAQRLVPAPVTTPVVALSANQSAVAQGDPIDYQLTVTNASIATLTGVSVSDPHAPDCEAPIGSLAPSASVTIDCVYNTGPDDAGPYTNTATVTSDQANAAASNTVTTQVGPAVTVTLSAPARVVATESIAYTVGITNNSALTLTGVRVSDTAVPSCAGPVADIDPGATATVNCARSTSDADSGASVFNAVFVDSTSAQGGFATAATRVAGRVTGTVTGPGGAPTAGAHVLALDRDFLPLRGDAVADGSGQFTLGLDPGRYYLAVLDPSGVGAAEYYNNKTAALSLGSSDLVTVASGSGPASVGTVSLASGFSPVVNPATISGVVSDANGPLAGVWVVAVNGGVRSVVRTNASGQYTVGNLPAGNAFLEFVDPAGTHAIRWYHNDAGGNPTPIALTAGQARTGFDELLPAYP